MARDASGRGHDAVYEDGIAFYLAGPALPGSSINRAPHLAGGCMRAELGLRGQYSIDMWFYNALPADTRAVTGRLFAAGSDCLSIGGTAQAQGRLLFSAGDQSIAGTVEIACRKWYHVVVIREPRKVAVYLNDAPDLSGEVAPLVPGRRVHVGGSEDGLANFEGKIDEVAVFDHPLLKRKQSDVSAR